MHNANHIIDSAAVVELLGCWPTFHDAEVISFSAERALPVKNGHTVARLSVHVRQYETIGEGTAHYEQVLCKSVLIRFVFNGVRSFELSDFNHQNVINSITVSDIEGSEPQTLHVEIDPIWGFGGSLQCLSVAVEGVELLPNAYA